MPLSFDSPDDVFLCCSSFEERCVAAVQKLDSGYRARMSFIFRFLPGETDEEGFEEARDRNAARLFKSLEEKTIDLEPTTIICDKHDVEDGATQLRGILDLHFPNGCKGVTIDMSSFTKVYFWELMQLLVENYSTERLRVIYTQSLSIPSDTLTSGAHPPAKIRAFSGRFSPARRTLLLGFVGFEPQRAILIYEEFEPDRAELFVSYNPRRPGYLDRALKSNEYLLTRPGIRWQRIEPYNPYVALEVLENALRANRAEGDPKNVVLMSLGTKVQNLAGFLFWRRHREVHLAYAFPTKYAKDHLRLQPGTTFAYPFEASKLKPVNRSNLGG